MGTREQCISCGETLVSDPNNSHWKRCLQCEPSFAAWVIQREEILGFMAAKRAAAELDKVGRPTRNGVAS